MRKDCLIHSSRLGSLTLLLLLLMPLSPALAKGLRDHAEGAGLFIGTAVRFYQFDQDTQTLISPFRDDPVYTQKIAKEFNMVTPENVMKMDTIHPFRDEYNFADADQLVDFAEEHEIAVRGHVLVWHSQTPPWLTDGNFSKAELQEILEEQVATVAGHYQGRLFAWDVVNEAINDVNGKLRESVWLDAGKDYIERAFRAARAADPDAVLCYNDYNHAASLSWQKPKSDAVYKMVKKLVRKKVPIDCVGFQFHVAPEFFDPAGIAENFQRYADLGLQVQITELDVSLPAPATAESLKKQATIYQKILDFCLAAPNCTSFVMWGFTDRYSWIPEFQPGRGDALILNEDYRKKPAYRKLGKSLKQAAKAATAVADR
jgi:endo-1,4-beta-xylanase